MGVLWLWAMALCVTCASADRGGSSLRGALEALQRRQRGRVLGPVINADYDTIYEVIPPQVYPEPDYPVDLEGIEEEQPKYIVKLLEDENRPSHAYEYKIVKKKMSQDLLGVKESAFRERAHHADNDRLKDLFNDGNEEGKKELEQERKKSDAEYALLLGQLWSKYKNTKEDSQPQGVVKLYRENVVKKRVPDNWGPIAFKRKRSSEFQAERPIVPEYESRKHDLDTDNSNYNAYEVADDDKDEIREEYAIAFQPLEDDSVPDPENEDIYTYDTVEKPFPVSKRSSAPYDFAVQKKRFIQDQSNSQNSKKFRSSSGTDPKLMKDLSRIFGDSVFEVIKNPVKRNSDHEESSHESKPPNLTILDRNSTHDHDNSTLHEDVIDEHEHVHMHHPGVSGKEVEHDHEHGHDHPHDHAHVHAHDQAHDNKHKEKPIIVKKKSIDWTDYFGIDKRSNKFRNDASEDKLRKQYFDILNKEVVYPLNSFRAHSNVKRNYVTPNANEESEFEMDNSRVISTRNEDKKKSDSDAKLDDIEKRLKNMEVLIVDEALHYSNAGEELDSKEEQEMKEKLLSRLAAAYSLEKMRKALKEFKQSLQTHKSHPEQEPSRAPVQTDEAKVKRVAVKKEKVDIDNEIPQFKEERSDDFEEEQGAGHYLNGKNEDQFSEGYMGGSGRHRSPVMSTVGAPGSCPVLEKIVQRCRGVDILSGDRGQLFLPLCSLHQTCYLCGEAPPTICDLVFLSEADTACSGDTNCQRVARDALMGLKELHDSLADELDGECEASPCLLATLKLNLGWQHAIKR